MSLSDEIVESTSVPEGKTQLKISDGGGLYLLVKHSGRYWKLAYRFEGKQKSLSLGVYPEVSLEQARIKREGAKDLLAQNMDPGLVKKQQKRGEQQSIPMVESRVVNTPVADKPQRESVPVTIQKTSSLTTPKVVSNKKTTPERRLAILQTLTNTSDHQLNEKEIQESLETLGFNVSFDRLRTDFAWLAEQEVVSINTTAVWLVQLTQYGLDVSHSRTWVPGINKPTN